MCTYKTLSHSDYGYIILCNNCKQIQLAFGTMAVKFIVSDFCKFIEQVDALYNATVCNGFPNQKRIHLDVKCNCAVMIISLEELEVLYHKVNEAKFILSLESILEQNHIESH